MIADLSMYDWPGIRAATDAFWTEVAARLRADGIDAPPRLARIADHGAAWAHPDLLLGQTCGMPFVSGLCGDAVIVARPDYGLEAARDGLYRSVVVARAGEVTATGPEALLARSGSAVAVNEWRSYSGHVALRAHLATLRPRATSPFFGAAALSGSHRESARMVAVGAADIAALDGVVWALLEAEEPETFGRLAVLDLTAPAPALPLITAGRFAGLRDRLAAALAGAAGACPAVTGLPRRIAAAGAEDYVPTRLAARRAAAEPFAPGAPDIPAV